MSAPVLHAAIPTLRIYDKDKVLEFYRDFLGCTVDWEHRFAGGMALHPSEHYGDGTPGTAVWIKVKNSRSLFEELHTKQARFARPGVDSDEATLTDPFGNMLRFDGSRN
ncbi:MAG: glyoxalase superfamily protein [Pseudomonadota bacterium]